MTRVTSLDEILALSPLELFLLPDGYYWYEKTGAMFVVSCRAVIENVLWDGGTRRCSRKVCQLFSGWTPRIALASTGACRILSHLA
mmetsp:Transcript_10531/g.18076  ORF Transcript_10531/g.18076 Transcript_10531/m.18076 type:complete len:86 (-) Transcript_10531:1433-1690(-)